MLKSLQYWIGALGWFSFFAAATCGLASDEAIRITLRAGKSEVAIGEKISLEELIPAGLKVEVNGVRHTVLRIGYYDEKKGSLVNVCDPSRFLLIPSDRVFKDLPRSLRVSHVMNLEIKNAKHQGSKYLIQPNRIGIFLVIATWTLRNGEAMSSNPVILTVNPPLDDLGRAIIKSQWLEDD